MDFCEGGSLDAIYKSVKTRGGRMGEKILGKVAEAVLHGLVYLHDRRIIHRDIKVHGRIAGLTDTAALEHPRLPQRASQAVRLWRLGPARQLVRRDVHRHFVRLHSQRPI